MPPTISEDNELRPLEEGEFIDNGDGTRSTERAASFNINDAEVLIPMLWMTRSGPVDFSDATVSAVRAALDYERRTGRRFPRFKTPAEATLFSRRRSDTGGIANGPLAR